MLDVVEIGQGIYFRVLDPLDVLLQPDADLHRKQEGHHANKGLEERDNTFM